MSKLGRHSLVLGACSLAFALRVMGLARQSLWRDEVDAVRFALQPLADLLRLFVSPGQNGPLYYLALRPWLELAGQSEFALRFPSALLGVLAVPLIYRLARHLFPGEPAIALLSALLAATSPYLVWYGQEGKMYALLVLLVLLSMNRYLSALDQGGWQRWLGYVVVTGMAFYVHLTAVLIVPAQAAAFALCDGQMRRSRWQPWLGSLLVLTIPYLPLMSWQLPMLAEPGETGFGFVPLPGMIRSLTMNYSLGVALSPSPWIVAPFLAALLAAATAWTQKGFRRSLLFLLFWLLLPVGALFLVSLGRPLFTARYLIIVLPAYLVLLAVGLGSVVRRAPGIGAILLGTILAISGWGLVRQAHPIKADFRGATRYIAQEQEQDDLLLFQIPYGRHSFEYYVRRQRAENQSVDDQADLRAPEPHWVGGLPLEPCHQAIFLPWVTSGRTAAYRWAEGPYTNHGMTPEQVDQHMHELIDDSKVVWLVATEVSLWDERGLVQAWLDRNGVLADESAFVRVLVRRYRMP